MFGNDLVRFGPVRFGKKNSGSVRFGGSVKILVRSNTRDFWDRGQSLSHLALLVRQDWSARLYLHPYPLSKLNHGRHQYIGSLEGT